MQTLAAARLSELQEAKDANLILLERVQGLQVHLEVHFKSKSFALSLDIF